MSLNRPDILILGAGILGSSTAWHLARRHAGTIAVLDLDLAGTYSSSELNAGGCRATWWHPVNVELAWRSMQFYRSIADEIQFFRRGYLFLHSAPRWQIACGKKSLYDSFKIPIEYLEGGEISARIPEFENLKGVAGATFSPEDGLLDPHLLREYYRREAKALGVQFLDHFYVQGMESSAGRIDAINTLHYQGGESLGEEALRDILTRHRLAPGPNWQEEVFHPKQVLNCTGAWLPVTSQYYGRPSPVKPVRRQISLFSSHEEDFSGRGMVVDSSGLYFHPEGAHSGLILAGYSNRDEPPGYRFHYDGEKFFDRKIWLRLYRRGGRRHFSAIHHVRGWAGLYAVGPDKTGILWRVKDFDNLYELGAATGRGVMQSYALGLLAAELIHLGRFETMDASVLSGERFATGRLLSEFLDI